MKLTITAASTALFSTWVFIEELGLLFDAGDGVSAALCQKSRKARNIFISHADRDHVCGLLQLHQLNANDGSPTIYYPKDCGTFPALQDFVKRFDPQSGPATWQATEPGQRFTIKDRYAVRSLPSAHVISDGEVKALGYILEHSRRKLRPEYQGLPGKAIAEKKQVHGEDVVTEEVIDRLIGYSGDAPSLEPTAWEGVKTLLHESTFLDAETNKGSHSNVPQVISAASEMELEALILFHFSSRYTAEEIAEKIKTCAKTYAPKFPIYAVMPCVVSNNILSQEPIWSP